jgi:hypothetical protein
MWMVLRLHWIWSMVWVMRLSHKVLGHKPCSLKSFLVHNGNGIGHSICKDCYRSIIMTYLDRVKMQTSGWCVGVMYWTNHESYFFSKILSIGIIVTSETSYDIDSKFWENCELSQVKVTLLHLWVRPYCSQNSRCIGWSHVTLWESFSQ